MTAAGNTTTRLLGTFQKVDYVFIIGVAGGVPHYTDFKKHVRLGDVVISHSDQSRSFNGLVYKLSLFKIYNNQYFIFISSETLAKSPAFTFTAVERSAVSIIRKMFACKK